jgi:hypothetical protein
VARRQSTIGPCQSTRHDRAGQAGDGGQEPSSTQLEACVSAHGHRSFLGRIAYCARRPLDAPASIVVVMEGIRDGVRTLFGRRSRAPQAGPACSWEAMRQVYIEQAARGIPEAIRGLELIEQGRWPRSGRPHRHAPRTR